MSVPCSYRVDKKTIYASEEIGNIIKCIAETVDSDEIEELAMCLYFMHQRVLGEKSHLHSSIVTATPPDLPIGWSD
jgi:hypothetical protein